MVYDGEFDDCTLNLPFSSQTRSEGANELDVGAGELLGALAVDLAVDEVALRDKRVLQIVEDARAVRDAVGYVAGVRAAARLHEGLLARQCLLLKVDVFPRRRLWRRGATVERGAAARQQEFNAQSFAAQQLVHGVVLGAVVDHFERSKRI